MADIDAEAVGSALDSVLYLYAADGVTELTRSDNYDGLDSRIIYTLPSDGNYYLAVHEFSQGSEGGPDYFYTLSLSTAPPPPDVVSNWTDSAPTPDGHIQPGEWADAAMYDITIARAKGDRPRRTPAKESGEVHTGGVRADLAAEAAMRYETVTLYVKNDATHLYLAIDNPNDTTASDWDEMGVYFDDNPLPSDGQWTNSSCGNADGWIVNSDTWLFDGEWPSVVQGDNPATYGQLRLATGQPVCNEPPSPWLASPANGASIADTTPDFDWADATHATAYRIQVDDAPDFATPVTSATTTASAFTPSTPLPPGTYYWRVQGWNNAGGCDVVGPWSATRALRIKSSLFLPVVIKR